ncbi:MAG TPA: hypothetical protein VFD32_02745 [Dehalococcoidia bacterium]|nr:hypothetical protein [Dehalococcoidia bacterium]
MRPSRSPLLVALAAGLALLAACSGGNNNKHPAGTSSATSGAAGTPGVVATAQGSGTPRPGQTPGVGQPPAPPPIPSVASAGTPGANGCLTFPLLPLDTANLPTQPPRPAIQLPQLTVPQSAILPGFKADDGGQYNPQEQRSVTDIASGTVNPQAAVEHLQQIGYLGGRQQGFTGPQANGAIATITVQHLIFSSDAGASNFLRAPVIGSFACVKQAVAPQIGQETNAFSYSATAARSSTPFEGYSVAWRCGRVLINVTLAGAPGQYTLAQTVQVAQKVQAAFLQSGQPCS